MADVSEYIVKIDLKGDANTGLGKLSGTVKKVSGDIDKAGASVAKTEGRFGALGAKLRSPELKSGLMQGVGLSAGLIGFQLLSQGIGAVVAIAGEAQQAASDLGEQQSKLDQVFTSSSATIRDWADDAATSLGLSERAALEATGTLGNFLQAMGTTEAASADMSMGLVSLASDIASFNNVAGGAEEVLIAIQAGLAGETEPLRRYGVDISDAAVQTRLLADGVQKVGGAFTQTQKIQARYTIIMEKTKKAQGDYARTAASSANQERTLAALRENALASMGVYFDNILKVGQALAIEFVGGLVAAADAIGELNKILFPHEELIRQTEAAIREIAKARGIDAAAVIALAKAQRTQAEALKTTDGRLAEAAKLEEELRVATKDYTLALTAEQLGMAGRIGLLRLGSDATEEHATAVGVNADALKAANLTIEEFLALSKEEQSALGAIAAQTEMTTEKQDALNAAVAAAAERNKAYTASTQAARQGIEDLADSVDYAKGSFKSFWKQLREDQQRIKFLIRNPNLVENELNRIEKAISKSEKQKQALLADGFQISEALALKAMDDRIAALRLKQGSYLALGKLYGNTTESGMESSFDPRLVAYVDITTRGAGAAQGMFGPPVVTGKRKDGARGATYYPGDYGFVGEVGPERISNRGGITTITPMGGRDILAGAMRPMVVSVRTVMSAYQSNREIQRTVNTHRMASNAL